MNHSNMKNTAEFYMTKTQKGSEFLYEVKSRKNGRVIATRKSARPYVAALVQIPEGEKPTSFLNAFGREELILKGLKKEIFWTGSWMLENAPSSLNKLMAGEPVELLLHRYGDQRTAIGTFSKGQIVLARLEEDLEGDHFHQADLAEALQTEEPQAEEAEALNKSRDLQEALKKADEESSRQMAQDLLAMVEKDPGALDQAGSWWNLINATYPGLKYGDHASILADIDELSQKSESAQEEAEEPTLVSAKLQEEMTQLRDNAQKILDIRLQSIEALEASYSQLQAQEAEARAEALEAAKQLKFEQDLHADAIRKLAQAQKELEALKLKPEDPDGSLAEAALKEALNENRDLQEALKKAEDEIQALKSSLEYFQAQLELVALELKSQDPEIRISEEAEAEVISISEEAEAFHQVKIQEAQELLQEAVDRRWIETGPQLEEKLRALYADYCARVQSGVRRHPFELFSEILLKGIPVRQEGGIWSLESDPPAPTPSGEEKARQTTPEAPLTEAQDLGGEKADLEHERRIQLLKDLKELLDSGSLGIYAEKADHYQAGALRVYIEIEDQIVWEAHR